MKKYVMPESQKIVVRAMDSGEILDFQLRLQIECGLDDQEAADYIAQAWEKEVGR